MNIIAIVVLGAAAGYAFYSNASNRECSSNTCQPRRESFLLA